MTRITAMNKPPPGGVLALRTNRVRPVRPRLREDRVIAVREQRVAVQGSPIPLVRRAAKSEHDPIRQLLRVGFGQYATDIAPPVWADYLADLLDLDRHAHDGQLLVGVVAGQIVGYAAFYPDASSQGLGWPPGWAGGRGLAVHPAHRGDGIAAALMARWSAAAAPRGPPSSPSTPPRS